MIRRFGLIFSFLVLLGGCRRQAGSKTPPRLPEPPGHPVEVREPLSGFEQYGFLFVVYIRGQYFVQLSPETLLDDPEPPGEGTIELVQFTPYPVTLAARSAEEAFSEAHNRPYTLMKLREPVCRGNLDTPRRMALLHPNSTEWENWDVDPWSEPPPELGEVEKKIPLLSFWQLAGVITAAPLSQCERVKHQERFMWARPGSMPEPHFLVTRDPRLAGQYVEQATRKILEAGFQEKVNQWSEDMGEPFSPDIEVVTHSDSRHILVEVRATIGESECGPGGDNDMWGLWKVTDGQWEKIDLGEKMQSILFAGDLNQDGLLELLVVESGPVPSYTLYQLEGLQLRKVMRMHIPFHEAAC